MGLSNKGEIGGLTAENENTSRVLTSGCATSGSLEAPVKRRAEEDMTAAENYGQL